MDAVWDVLTGALLFGWCMTAVFGAVAGGAVAVWARVNVVIGVVVGFLTVFAGLAVLLVIGIVRAVARRRRAPSTTGATPRAATAGSTATAAPRALVAGQRFALPAAAPASPPAWSLAPQAAPVHGVTAAGSGPAARSGFGNATAGWSFGPAAGSGASSRGGFAPAFGPAFGGADAAGDSFGARSQPADAWPATTTGALVPAGDPPSVLARRATPATVRARMVERVGARVQRPSWPAIAVAVLAILVAVGFVVTTQLTWVTVRGLDGRELMSVGPFGLQLGSFVAASALVAGLSGVGVLLWRSAWWSVLCAWCASWWIFVAVEALSVSDSVSALNRFVQSTVSSRVGYEEHAALLFGGAWTYLLVAGVALLVTSVALLVLQHHGTSRRVA